MSNWNLSRITVTYLSGIESIKMDSSFEIGSDYGELIRENNKLQKLVTDLNLELNPCQVKFHFKMTVLIWVI